LIWDYFWIGLYKGFEYKEHPLFLKIWIYQGEI
jgi:hypothetical protein